MQSGRNVHAALSSASLPESVLSITKSEFSRAPPTGLAHTWRLRRTYPQIAGEVASDARYAGIVRSPLRPGCGALAGSGQLCVLLWTPRRLTPAPIHRSAPCGSPGTSRAAPSPPSGGCSRGSGSSGSPSSSPRARCGGAGILSSQVRGTPHAAQTGNHANGLRAHSWEHTGRTALAPAAQGTGWRGLGTRRAGRSRLFTTRSSLRNVRRRCGERADAASPRARAGGAGADPRLCGSPAPQGWASRCRSITRTRATTRSRARRRRSCWGAVATSGRGSARRAAAPRMRVVGLLWIRRSARGPC